MNIESKDDMHTRGVPSPDRADARCYAWVQNEGTMLQVNSLPGKSLTGDLLEALW